MSASLTTDAALGGVGSVDGSEIVRNYEEKGEKWLAFWLGKQLFAFSIIDVEQIIRMMPITEIPYYPAYAKGIINLRGAVIPIIDLRVLLNMGDAQDTFQTCIIIVNLCDLQVGFIVDGVNAVLDIPDDTICQPPTVNRDNVSKYLTGIATVSDSGMDDQNVLLIDMGKILQTDEFDMFVLRDT